MLKNNYMIVLYGEILPGENLETVKEKLAKHSTYQKNRWIPFFPERGR